MRLTTATPRLLRPLASTASENAASRELRLVREEAQRQVSVQGSGTAIAATSPPEGLSGSLLFLWNGAKNAMGNPAQPGQPGSLETVVEPIKTGLSDLAGRLGDWLRGAAGWDTGLPPVGSTPAKPTVPPSNDAAEALKRMTPEQLANLGSTNKKGFFDALRPAAEEAERQYGVPAEVIMAQAALETGWGQHIIPGYNIFGHKGTGPAGTVTKRTWEVINGEKVWIDAGFAKYNNFYEAVSYAGKRYHNGYYDKAVENYAQYKDPKRFARDITGIYATDPEYGDKLIRIMDQYGLLQG